MTPLTQADIEAALSRHLHDEGLAPGDAKAVELAEAAVDFLIGACLLIPSDRWDEECHRCGQTIGDHTIRPGCEDRIV